MAHSLAEFRRYLGSRAAHYTDAQLQKALDLAAKNSAVADDASDHAHPNGNDHLDRQGGELPVIDPEMLKRADFITYPKRIREGSNCHSCRFNQNVRGVHQCGFYSEEKGIDLRGQLVNESNCCGMWDSTGVLRSWENGTVNKSLTIDRKLRRQITEAAKETERNPSDRQKESGNYRKGRVTIHGLPIAIENPRGSKRSGIDPGGKPWSVTMAHHYGYVARTESDADGDPVDVFIGPNPESEIVYVVNQVDQHGDFDEHKALLGFLSEEQARQGYLDCYSSGWKCGEITPMTIPQFKEWIRNGKTGNPLPGQRVTLGHEPAVAKAAWDSSKHPRGGHPENPGEFSHNAGTRPHPGPEPERYPDLPGAPGAKSPGPNAATRNTGELKRPTPADYQKRTQHFSPSSWAEHSPLHKSLEQKKKMLTTDLSSGVNRAYLLRLADGTKGVFKPQSGESKKSVPSIPPQTGFRREVAASRVADILGLSDLVPATTFRTEPAQGIGSMQAYAEKAKNATEVTRGERYDGLEDARRAAVLDYLLCQIDRHQNNWMLQKGKLALIDNGRAFPTHYEKREFELSAMFHMEFLRHAVVNNLDVPDLSQWRGKWEAIEKEMRDCGIEDSAVQLAKQRYDDLMSRDSRKFADLPGFLEGHTLGQLFAAYGKRPAGFQES